jgi:Fe-Mn family superoxide dismutase
MAICAAPLTMKPPRLKELSQKLVESHYENNYGGAVRRLNSIDEQLKSLDFVTVRRFELNGLKREQLVAADSVTLHEIYFDSLGGSGGDPENIGLAAAMQCDFGSLTVGGRNLSLLPGHWAEALAGCCCIGPSD